MSLVNILSSAWDYVFAKTDQVMVIIEPEKATQAEEIFRKYYGRFWFKRDSEHYVVGRFFTMDLASTTPNRVTLGYVVASYNFQSLFREFHDKGIAGTSSENRVFRRPHSLRSRLGI